MEEPSYNSSLRDLYNLQGIHLINNIIDIVKTTYDKKSKYEKYNSIEEKKEALFNEMVEKRKDIIEIYKKFDFSIDAFLRMLIIDRTYIFEDERLEPHVIVKEEIKPFSIDNYSISDFEISEELENYFNRIGFYKIEYKEDK